MQLFLSFVWLLIPLTFAPLHYAHAYLDPGSGSYAIQMIIGLLVGGTYMLKSFGSRLLSGFKKRNDKKTEE